MKQWKHHLRIKDEWELAKHGAIAMQDLATVIAKRLAKIDFGDVDTNFDRDDIIDNFKSIAEDITANKEDFDGVMEELYDFADRNSLWVAWF